MELHSPHRDPYDPLNKLVDELKEKGYHTEFKVKDSTTMHDEKGTVYDAENVSISTIHRFADRENKTENKMVIAMETGKGTKGYMVCKYGADEDDTIAEFLQKADQTEVVTKNY